MERTERWVRVGALGALAGVLCWGRVVAAEPASRSAEPASVESALVESSAVEPASAPAVVQVWYRSSEGCPDGKSFLGLLERLGRTARLAGPGDRVDFVVALASSEGASNGRLERQTSERTVAIRDVSSASCDEVASVLALSLDLALQPAPTASASPAVDAPSVDAPSVEALRVDNAPARPSSAWGLGAQATIETGLGHAVLPGAALFVGLAPPESAWSLRLYLRGAMGTRDAVRSLHVGLLAARAEGCWGWSLASIRVGPCAGLDAGLAFASGAGENGRSDLGDWSAAAAHLRAIWGLEGVAFEAQFGALVPLVRYRLSARAGGNVTDSAPIGMQAALGVSFFL